MLIYFVDYLFDYDVDWGWAMIVYVVEHFLNTLQEKSRSTI